MTYLKFITLGTGAVERTIDPGGAATDPAALDLARALRDESSAIAGRQGYTIKALTSGRALVCTTYGPAGQPLTTFGVAARSAGAAELWDMLNEHAFPGRAATEPPGAPWCAVHTWSSMLTDPAAPWQWLAAYELDIAWAWIKRRHRGA